MKKTIYLHVGMHKTGTTTIQDFLYINKDSLLLHGYDYLVGNCVWSAHHPLGWAFQGVSNATRHYCPWHERGIINHLEDEISCSGKNNFIVSSENLFQLKNIEFIERFFKRFQDFEFKVLVYLREQASFLESWYCELVRADYCKLDKEFDEFVDQPMYNLDYNSGLMHWTSFVSKKNIFLFDYSSVSKNGGLIKSLCGSLGLAMDEFIVPSKSNERVSPVQLGKLLELNRKKIEHAEWMKERDEILSAPNIFDAREESAHSLLSKALREKIYNRYKQSNALLESNFGFVFD